MFVYSPNVSLASSDECLMLTRGSEKSDSVNGSSVITKQSACHLRRLVRNPANQEFTISTVSEFLHEGYANLFYEI